MLKQALVDSPGSRSVSELAFPVVDIPLATAGERRPCTGDQVSGIIVSVTWSRRVSKGFTIILAVGAIEILVRVADAKLLAPYFLNRIEQGEDIVELLEQHALIMMLPMIVISLGYAVGVWNVTVQGALRERFWTRTLRWTTRVSSISAPFSGFLLVPVVSMLHANSFDHSVDPPSVLFWMKLLPRLAIELLPWLLTLSGFAYLALVARRFDTSALRWACFGVMALTTAGFTLSLIAAVSNRITPEVARALGGDVPVPPFWVLLKDLLGFLVPTLMLLVLCLFWRGSRIWRSNSDKRALAGASS